MLESKHSEESVIDAPLEVSREYLDHTDPLHRIAAEKAAKRGAVRIVEKAGA